MKGTKARENSNLLRRRTVITCLILLIIILIVATVILFKEAMKKENIVEEIIYTEGSSLKYKVYLKENEFFGNEYLTENRQYIASLIKFVSADFRYNLQSSKPNEVHKYNYKIVAEVNVEQQSNKNSIYKFNEILLEKKNQQFNTIKGLNIKENITIDYNKYNDIIRSFINTYNLDDIKSTLTVKMYIEVDGITKVVAPVSALVIPLTTKTMAIDITSNTVNATDLSVYKEIANKNHLYIAVLLVILIVMVAIELYVYINNTKDDLSRYKTKVKKILQNYNSYIQKTDKDFNFKGYQEIEMETFEDLLQIRDTISKPILMIEIKENKETDFLIPCSEKVVYIYKFKIEDINK